jgi:hypothetical protein
LELACRLHASVACDIGLAARFQVQHCRLVMIVHVVHATGNLGPTECADTVTILAQAAPTAGAAEQAFLPFLLSLRKDALLAA